jgi:CDP-paratose 2-epimerase
MGIDNNARQTWFGHGGDTSTVKASLLQLLNYRHVTADIANYEHVTGIIRDFEPDLVIHCAAQPSHEKSAEIPLEDFHVNTTGTINLLEAVRLMCPWAHFILVSTNKVYGDRPNHVTLTNSEIRFNFIATKYQNGINENMSIDGCTHSPYGASKTSADIITQEYGRYFGIRTVCFRCGCITGLHHQGVEQHGFLNYLCKIAKSGQTYTIYGHGGKQVRDHIHAYDLVQAFDCWVNGSASPGEVYNMGGGRQNACSILEAIQMIRDISGLKIKTQESVGRKGDHLCYYTDFSKFQRHHPEWVITRDLKSILTEMLFI